MTTLRQQLTTAVLNITGVSEMIWPDRSDGFSSFIYKHKDFAHFHNDNELDLRLGKKVIASKGLIPTEDSEHHPKRSKNSPWIELRFHGKEDVDDIVCLVELAVQSIA